MPLTPARRAAGTPLPAVLRVLRRLVMLSTLVPASLAVAGDPRQLVSSSCANCHGADGNSVKPSYPKLAGQPTAYLVKQIGEFYAGTRAHELITPNAIPLAAEDVTGVANYFSQQKPTRGPVGEPTLSEIGKLLYTIGNPKTGLPSCDGCHSPDGSGGGRFPRLAGQHREYLIKQLDDIRAGRRNSSALMRAVADRMGELETRALATYLSAL